MKINQGDLVMFPGSSTRPPSTPGWEDYPGIYTSCQSTWIGEAIGVVLETRGKFFRVLVCGKALWVGAKSRDLKVVK